MRWRQKTGQIRTDGHISSKFVLVLLRTELNLKQLSNLKTDKDVINSRTVIAGAIIGLLLVFFLFRHDFCYDHMTSQPDHMTFIRSCNFN